MKKSSLWALSLVFIFSIISVLTSNSAFAEPAKSLGIGVDVLPAQGDEDSSLGADGSLWYLLPPGKSGTRSFRVNSLATVPMRVQVSVGFGAYRDGSAAFDDAKKSDIATWANFSEDNFTLAPGSSRIVKVRFRVPENAPIKANLATIFVRGSMQNQSPSKAAFSVPGAARIAIPVFLGVGTAAQIAINFKIGGTTIRNVEGKRLAYIKIQNLGQTPVAPTGLIRVEAQKGSISIPDPIKVQSSTVIPGQSRDVIFLVPDYIPNGKWTFREEFQQGPVFQTAEANIELTKPSIFTKANVIRFLAFVFALLIFYFSIRTLRRLKKKEESAQELNLETPDRNLFVETKKDGISRGARKVSSKRSPSKKSTMKAPTKKSPSKKHSTAKSTKKSTKKSTTDVARKKRPTKKAPTKRAAAQKRTTKKTVTKK